MEPVPRPDVSPAEQERTIGALQAAVGRGLISLDEFSARTDRVLAAGSSVELATVVADLPDDFREARFAHPIVTIDLSTAHSTVLLIVPPEVGIDVESVRPNHTKLPESIGPSDSGPILTLRGETEHGRVKVRRSRGG